MAIFLRDVLTPREQLISLRIFVPLYAPHSPHPPTPWYYQSLLIANDCYLYKREKKEIWTQQRHKEEGHVKMESEIQVILPQAKECLESLEAGRGKKEFFPKAFRGDVALPMPWFCTSVAVVLSHEVHGNLFWQPLASNTTIFMYWDLELSTTRFEDLDYKTYYKAIVKQWN